MIALVSDSAAGVSCTGAPAPRSRATSLRWMPVSRLTRLSVCSFALEREIVLGDVDEELAEQLRQCRKGHAAADAEPHERAQQPRQRRVQLCRGNRLWKPPLWARDLAFMAKL